MNVLIPVDASSAALAPLAYLKRLAASGIACRAIVLNVQPRFHRHVAQFTSRKARDELRAERSRAAMARAIEELSAAGIPFTALSDIGDPAQRIAQAAERERVDAVLIGVGRHPAWLRWLNPSIAQKVMALTDIPVSVHARGRPGAFERFVLPAGAAGIAALLIAAD